jgi:methionyl-tRNA formyltransferase
MLQFASIIPREEQDQNEARYFEKPVFEDTFIQWNRMSADLIVSLINACNPWNQGADALLNGQSIKLLTASMFEETHESVPGTILELTEDAGMKVACMNNQVIHVGILSSDFGIMTPKQFSAIKKIAGFRFN